MDTRRMKWEIVRSRVFRKHLTRDDEKNIQLDIMKLDPDTILYEHSHPEVEWYISLKAHLAIIGVYSEKGVLS